MYVVSAGSFVWSSSSRHPSSGSQRIAPSMLFSLSIMAHAGTILFNPVNSQHQKLSHVLAILYHGIDNLLVDKLGWRDAGGKVCYHGYRSVAYFCFPGQAGLGNAGHADQV